jgi:hypothetical protein
VEIEENYLFKEQERLEEEKQKVFESLEFYLNHAEISDCLIEHLIRYYMMTNDYSIIEESFYKC